MTQLIRINGQRNNIYYIEIYPNETLEDIIILFSKKYHRSLSNFTLDDNEIDKTSKISDLLKEDNKRILSFNALDQIIDSNSSNSSNSHGGNSSSTAKSKVDKKLDPKIQSLVDKFVFHIGLTVPKEMIIDVLRNHFVAALGSDPDNRERIKAVEYLIKSEGNINVDINQYQNKDQKALKKIMKKIELPFCIIAYVYDGNSHDKDKALKHLKAFLSKDADD